MYDQLKKSPHDSIGVLGRSTVLMASVKDRMDGGQRSGVIDRSILQNGCTILLQRIDST